ncbi:MAG: hypothetical protein J0M26_18115 [Planctomycetes bacterium]|nr:hypothetical protein [Planctomycetota bacterium]
MKPDQKRKIRKRLEQLKRRDRADQPTQSALQFPRLVFVGENAPDPFTDYLEKATHELDLKMVTGLSDLHRGLLGLMSRYGKSYVYQHLRAAFLAKLGPSADHFAINVFMDMASIIGEELYSSIPEQVRKEAIPFSHADLEFRENEIRVSTKQLERRILSNGSGVFLSPLHPTVQFGNKEYQVSFTRHAIERIRERMKDEYISYGASGDVYGFFARAVFFEVTELYPDQLAIGLWDHAVLPFSAQYKIYIEQILGEDNMDWSGGLPYYRLGYCPIQLYDGVAIAKTFLVPGFRNTPEYGGLKNNQSLSLPKKRGLLELANKLISADVVFRSDFELIQWFHENGFPQVRQMTHEVFRYSDRSIRMIVDMPLLVARRRQLIQQGVLPRTMFQDS